ncbi:hypothetical protein VIGAN_06126900, partial [Vigna angularis var. angularis]
PSARQWSNPGFSFLLSALCMAMVGFKFLFCEFGPLRGNGQIQVLVLRYWPSAKQWSSRDFSFSNGPLLGNGRTQ